MSYRRFLLFAVGCGCVSLGCDGHTDGPTTIDRGLTNPNGDSEGDDSPSAGGLPNPNSDGEGFDLPSDGGRDTAFATLEEALDGRTFVFESAEGYMALADWTPWVSFEMAKIHFGGGCNGYFSEARFEGDVLILDDIQHTLIRCAPPERQLQDQWFADFFSQRPTVTVDGDRVTFARDEATVVFLDNAVANPAPPLVGTVWQISGLMNGQSFRSGYASVVFSEDGTVQVSTECNTGEGQYAVEGGISDDGIITFGEITYTEIACGDPEQGDAEAHVQSVLREGEVTYSFVSQTLLIDRLGVGVSANSTAL